MGLVISWLASLVQSSAPCKILMVGLGGAGKTTILYKLKLGKVEMTIPTMGFNVETVEYKNITFTVWDIAGHGEMPYLWRNYYQGSSAIIFVVDSNDSQCMPDAREALDILFESPELDGCPLLVMANKQDLPDAASASWITDALNLRDLRRPWFVQGTSAINSNGIYESLDWLAAEVSKKS